MYVCIGWHSNRQAKSFSQTETDTERFHIWGQDHWVPPRQSKLDRRWRYEIALAQCRQVLQTLGEPNLAPNVDSKGLLEQTKVRQSSPSHFVPVGQGVEHKRPGGAGTTDSFRGGLRTWEERKVAADLPQTPHQQPTIGRWVSVTTFGIKYSYDARADRKTRLEEPFTETLKQLINDKELFFKFKRS